MIAYQGLYLFVLSVVTTLVTVSSHLATLLPQP